MTTTAINDIVTTIGVDLGKVFHIIGMNARGAVCGSGCLAPNCRDA